MKSLTLALAVVCPLACSAALAGPKWQKTVEGCLFQNPNPAPRETVSWSGDCVDGKISGYGTLSFRFPRSGQFMTADVVGNVKDGVIHGEVRIEHSNGKLFVGEYRNGVRYKGRLTHPDGDWFEGYFRRWAPKGKGMCRLDGVEGPCVGRNGWVRMLK